jgi:hypothetical protein
VIGMALHQKSVMCETPAAEDDHDLAAVLAAADAAWPDIPPAFRPMIRAQIVAMLHAARQT